MIGLAMGLVGSFAAPASADLVVTFAEDNADVTATISGTFDTPTGGVVGQGTSDNWIFTNSTDLWISAKSAQAAQNEYKMSNRQAVGDITDISVPGGWVVDGGGNSWISLQSSQLRVSPDVEAMDGTTTIVYRKPNTSFATLGLLAGETQTITYDSLGGVGSVTWSIVPEPTSLALLGLGGLALMRRRSA